MSVGEFLWTLFVGALVGGCIAVIGVGAHYRSNAVERGYALYCPTTGEFAWKGECEQ